MKREDMPSETNDTILRTMSYAKLRAPRDTAGSRENCHSDNVLSLATHAVGNVVPPSRLQLSIADVAIEQVFSRGVRRPETAGTPKTLFSRREPRRVPGCYWPS